MTWVPREVVEQLGIPRLLRRSFVVADGRTVGCDTAAAILQLGGAEASVTWVAGEAGDGRLRGATALESLGVSVDTIRRRLVPRELLAM